MKQKIEPNKWLRWPSSDHTPLQGNINEYGFTVSRIINHRNSWLPVLNGKFTPTNDGTTISITMTLHPLVLTFTLYFIVMLGFFFIIGVVELIDTGNWGFIATVGGMVLFVITLTLGCFWAEAQKTKDLITSVFLELQQEAGTATMTFVVLALGGNLGDVPHTFRRAIDALQDAGMKKIKVSSFRQTAPVDCVPGSADFINAAICGVWHDTPETLLMLCQQLEFDAGRPRKHGINSPRPLDIDIIIFGEHQISLPHLTIPHPETGNRLFVLEPAAEIAPDCLVPGLNHTFSKLLSNLTHHA
jgi:2-amino-4-hydroxy-6-hydroxymethyldihydropteridine diphosphokinase